MNNLKKIIVVMGAVAIIVVGLIMNIDYELDEPGVVKCPTDHIENTIEGMSLYYKILDADSETLKLIDSRLYELYRTDTISCWEFNNLKFTINLIQSGTFEEYWKD